MKNAIMIPAWRDGELTPVEKLAVHREGLRHKAISVFVMRGQEVLLQRRAMCKYHTPGLWANTCCTHPQWEETPVICARRRLFEELGISGLALEHRDQVEYRADVGDGLWEHEVVDIFLAKVGSGGLDISPDPKEVMATRWVGIERLMDDIAARPDAFTPWLRIYLDQHRTRIFGELIAA